MSESSVWIILLNSHNSMAVKFNLKREEGLYLQKTIGMKRDICSVGGVRRCVIGIYWVEARDGAQHPTLHRPAPKAKIYSTQNVNNSKGEKPYPIFKKKKTTLIVSVLQVRKLNIKGTQQSAPNPRTGRIWIQVWWIPEPLFTVL